HDSSMELHDASLPLRTVAFRAPIRRGGSSAQEGPIPTLKTAPKTLAGSGQSAEARSSPGHQMPIHSRMSRLVPILVLAAALAGVAPLSADPSESDANETGVLEISHYNGSVWAPLNRHPIYLTGPGATTAGTATA